MPEHCDGRYLDTIQRSDIEQLISTFARQVKPGTVNRHLTLLKAFFRDAVENKRLETNPAQFIKKLRENNERVRFLSEAETERLLDALPEKYRSVVKFAILTGLRRGEIFKLEWQDVDFEGRVLTVR